MQKRDNLILKKVDKNRSATLDRFLKFLWNKEVECKINI